MITGCNTNVLYRGRQFHVQTEDSGRANPHIISHVYHGGTIIASEKSEYGDRIDSEEIDIKVRAKIELQHKTMLKRLTSGELDAVIDERIGGIKPAEKPAPPRAVAPAVAKRPARVARPAASAAGPTANAADTASAIASGADTASSSASAADTASAIASGAATAGSVASAADSSGSTTAGAATDPSTDAGRPVADTEPMLEAKRTPGFGSSFDSEKPLDEVILEYLVDKARGRAAGKKQPPARRQHRKE